MLHNRSAARYRRFYGVLLRLYPRKFYARFSNSMEQTFADLLRERMETDERLILFLLVVFANTTASAIGEHMMELRTRKPLLVSMVIIPALILSVPLIAMQFSDAVDWSIEDFLVAGILLTGGGIAYELIGRRTAKLAYRVAAGMTLGTMIALVWISLAVGIIGNENNMANLMYVGVLAVGVLGAVLSGLQARGMARTLIGMAVAQCGVAGIGELAGYETALLLTAFFVVLWLGSACLYHISSEVDLAKP